jgi:subtilisin family serine protease
VGASENVRREFDSELYGDWWEDDYPRAPYRSAAMANDAQQVVAFSSRGPTRDGRTKPDVVAPGTFVLSSRSRVLSPSATGWAPSAKSRLYFHMGGTSMATPLAAGAAAVIREFLRTRVGYRSPSAALIKACLVVGAARLPTPSGELRGPVSDDAQGFGRVDVRAVVSPGPRLSASFVDTRQGLRTGQVDEYPVRVRSSDRRLRVALCYSDYPGPALVNDLNLSLRAPSGRRHVGNGGAGGALSFDRANNTELIAGRRPEGGTWSVQVIASNVPQGPQAYALALLGPLS